MVDCSNTVDECSVVAVDCDGTVVDCSGAVVDCTVTKDQTVRLSASLVYKIPSSFLVVTSALVVCGSIVVTPSRKGQMQVRLTG